MIKPTVSVIVPVRNTKKHIRKCLDSLKFQTLSDVEVIIIDDCSTEDIIGEISEYLDDKHFIYKRLPQSLGPGGARNAGLDMATGKYIGFCDSDDWVDFNYYKSAADALDSHEADIAMCSLVREYDATLENPVYKCKYNELLALNSDVTFRIMTYQYNMGIKVIPPCTNKVYSRAFLERINAKFEERIYFQDVLFSFNTILSSSKVLCVPGTEYHHYKRPNSIIQSFNTKHTDDFHRLFTLLREDLLNRGLYETYCFNYYKLLNHFYSLIIREIFEFVHDDSERKRHMAYSFGKIKDLIVLEEYLEYTAAEEIRRHIQPSIKDTTIY
jgi:glycosyltransferase involved in cell wall biosynthesis